MNHQEKLAFIRDKCIECVPEIVDTGFGCDVEVVIGSIACPATIVQKNYAGNWLVLIAGQTATYKNKQIHKIIGRPVHLADILLTLRDIGPMTHNVNALLLVGDQRLYEIQWNLRKDDLALQDEATVDFIYQILA